MIILSNHILLITSIMFSAQSDELLRRYFFSKYGAGSENYTLDELLKKQEKSKQEQPAQKKPVKNGHHIFEFSNGDLYDGMFLSGERHGYGKLTNGDYCYEGFWKNDCRDGRGNTSYGDGSSYSGEYSKGVHHGHGIFTWSNGANYVGQWVNGTMTGLGSFTWKNGNEYNGEFVNGKRHGKGKFTISLATRAVECNWTNNIPDDLATYSTPFPELCTRNAIRYVAGYCGQIIYQCKDCNMHVCRTCIIKHQNHSLTPSWNTFECGDKIKTG